MRYLLTIDPGVVCCGWSLWRYRNLINCGLSRTKKKTVEARVRDHNFQDWDFPHEVHYRLGISDMDKVVVEKPEVYQQRFWKGDPRDLIDLAMVVGAIISAMPMATTIYPKEWKGQLPKEVSAARSLKKLTPNEKKILEDPTVFGEPRTVPPSLRHNMMDAIGIGLKVLKR